MAIKPELESCAWTSATGENREVPVKYELDPVAQTPSGVARPSTERTSPAGLVGPGVARNQVTICARDADHCVATSNALLIQIWRYTPTRAAVIEMRKIAETLIATTAPRRICSVSLIHPTSPSPSTEARSELARFYSSIAPHADELILVPLGGRLRGAAIRGVGVALSSMVPGGLPLRFAETVWRAAQLVAPHTPAHAGGAAGVQSAIEDARAAADDARADQTWNDRSVPSPLRGA